METWSYISSQTNQISGYAANRINQKLPFSCSLLKEFKGPKHQLHKLDDKVEVALLYNEATSILEQLRGLLAEEKVKKITIVSPYFDKDGSTILLFKEIFENASIDVYLQSDSGLPPSEISTKEKINFYNWDDTLRGKKKIGGRTSYRRKLHGKIFHFKTDSAEYCLIGSPNATRHAIGSFSTGPSNEEFGALYKSAQIDFLKDLGVTGKKSILNIKNLQRPPLILGDEPGIRRHLKIRINSVDLQGYFLKVFLNKKLEEKKYNLIAYNMIGEETFSIPIEDISSSKLRFQLSEEELKSSSMYCLIAEKSSEPVSNKQLINFVTRLNNTDPSASNRKIRELINTIEGGVFNEFEIIEYLNELHSHKKTELEIQQTQSLRPKSAAEKEKDISGLTYEEAIKASEDSKDPLNIISNHSTSRIWDSLQQLFESNKDKIEQELMDEEEEGAEDGAIPGNTADPLQPTILIKSEKNVLHKFRSLQKMVHNYLESVERLRRNRDYKLDIIDYYQFLLVTTLLTSTCCFTDYEVHSKKFNKSDLKKELDLLYQDLMLEILMEFLRFCQQNKPKIYNQEEFDLREKQEVCLKSAKRRIFLYLSLIERRTMEEVALDKIKLIGLNFLETLGPLDSDFQMFIQDYSKYYKNLYFNPQVVIKFRNEIAGLSENNPQFVFTKYNGYGKIIDRRKKLKIRTLNNVLILSENELPKRE